MGVRPLGGAWTTAVRSGRTAGSAGPAPRPAVPGKGVQGRKPRLPSPVGAAGSRAPGACKHFRRGKWPALRRWCKPSASAGGNLAVGGAEVRRALPSSGLWAPRSPDHHLLCILKRLPTPRVFPSFANGCQNAALGFYDSSRGPMQENRARVGLPSPGCWHRMPSGTRDPGFPRSPGFV